LDHDPETTLSLRAVAHEPSAERCPCCWGADPSRLEHYLDNGFGFTLSEAEGFEVSFAVTTAPSDDFADFYLEQLRHLLVWTREISDEDHRRWESAIQAAFACGIEHAAQEVGVDFTAADVTTHIIEASIALRLVVDRLGPAASADTFKAEFTRMLEEGVTVEEATGAISLREQIAEGLERKRHQLSHDVATRLRVPLHPLRFRWNVVEAVACRPLPRAPRGARTRRRIRGASATRCRSPGRPQPPDDPADHVARLGGSLRLLRGRR
jgi:hypothetical protein